MSHLEHEKSLRKKMGEKGILYDTKTNTMLYPSSTKRAERAKKEALRRRKLK